MKEPVRFTSKYKPSKFVNLNNGYWFYNYDIKEESSADSNHKYSYIQIRIIDTPDYKKCVELIIREYITQSQEFDLINSAKMVEFGMLSEKDAKEALTKYKDYLSVVSSIKSKVKEDFE